MKLEDLEIYQIALKVSDLAWEIYQKLPREFRFKTGMQFLDAADSIGANISEGFGRYHYKDSLKFYYNSRGSLYETGYWLSRLKKRNLVDNDLYNRMNDYLSIEKLKLNKFISNTKSLIKN